MDEMFTMKLARVKAGFTQEQVAKMLGVSRNTYNDYENYNVVMKIDKGILFSQIVGIPFDDIIFFKQKYTSSVVDEWKDFLNL